MSTLDVNELSKSVDSFKRTVETLSQIKEISASLHDVAVEVKATASGMSSDTSSIADSAKTIETASSELSKKTDELIKEFEQSINGQEATIKAKTQECVDAVAGAVESIAADNKELRDLIKDYTISMSKSVDELRLLSSGNAREIREKIGDTEDHIRADMDKRFKDVESLMGEVSSLRAAVGKLQTISTVGCISAAIAAIVAAISFFI